MISTSAKPCGGDPQIPVVLQMQAVLALQRWVAAAIQLWEVPRFDDGGMMGSLIFVPKKSGGFLPKPSICHRYAPEVC